MQYVSIPSFFKSKMFNKNLHSLSEAFSSLEGDANIVTEIHMNEIDHDILKNDEDFKKLKDDDFQLWTASIIVNDSLDEVILYGTPIADYKNGYHGDSE